MKSEVLFILDSWGKTETARKDDLIITGIVHGKRKYILGKQLDFADFHLKNLLHGKPNEYSSDIHEYFLRAQLYFFNDDFFLLKNASHYLRIFFTSSWGVLHANRISVYPEKYIMHQKSFKANPFYAINPSMIFCSNKKKINKFFRLIEDVIVNVCFHWFYADIIADEVFGTELYLLLECNKHPYGNSPKYHTICQILLPKLRIKLSEYFVERPLFFSVENFTEEMQKIFTIILDNIGENAIRKLIDKKI